MSRNGRLGDGALRIERIRTPTKRLRLAPRLAFRNRVRNQCLVAITSDGSETLRPLSELVGYARVSTTEQEPALQLDALHGAGCSRVFLERASGAVADRPELAGALEYARAGDTLVVWRLDRLGRSLRHLIDTVGLLEEREIGFRSLQEQIDTTSPGGRLVFHLLAGLAEFERDLIRERTHAGLVAARARGRNGGRPPAMTPEKATIARQMYDSREHTVAAIAATLGVSRATIYRNLSQPDSRLAEAKR